MTRLAVRFMLMLLSGSCKSLDSEFLFGLHCYGIGIAFSCFFPMYIYIVYGLKKLASVFDMRNTGFLPDSSLARLDLLGS